MSNLKFEYKSSYELKNPKNEKFKIIKAYRDMNVYRTTGEIVASVPATYFYRQILLSAEYLKPFYLDETVYKWQKPKHFKYLGSTIFFHFEDKELYLADLYFSENKAYNVKVIRLSRYAVFL